MNVLRMGENPTVARLQLLRPLESSCDCAHANLNAVSSATTTIPRLTHGPQSIAPKIITIAKRGPKDLPITSPIFEKKLPRTSVLIESLRPTFLASLSFTAGYAIFISTYCNQAVRKAVSFRTLLDFVFCSGRNASAHHSLRSLAPTWLLIACNG